MLKVIGGLARAGSFSWRASQGSLTGYRNNLTKASTINPILDRICGVPVRELMLAAQGYYSTRVVMGISPQEGWPWRL